MRTSVFLTGATGVIGRHLLNRELPPGFHFVIITRHPEKVETNWPRDSYEIIKGDLLQPETWDNILSTCSYIVNLAGEKRDESGMEPINTEVPALLVNRWKAPVCNGFIHLSSAGIYGIYRQQMEEIKEDSPILPVNIYESTKAEGEKRLSEACLLKTIRHISLRPSNVLSIFDSEKRLLNLSKQIRNGRFRFVDKDAVVNYVYASTVAGTILELLTSGHAWPESCNINVRIKVESLAGQIARNLGAAVPNASVPKGLFYLACAIFERLPIARKPFDMGRYFELTNRKYYSEKRLERFYSGDAAKDLETGISEMIRNYKSNGWL